MGRSQGWGSDPVLRRGFGGNNRLGQYGSCPRVLDPRIDVVYPREW
jgi:hypothetical protein